MEENCSHQGEDGRIIVRVEAQEPRGRRRRHLTSVYADRASLPRVVDLINELRREQAEHKCARTLARLAG